MVWFSLQSHPVTPVQCGIIHSEVCPPDQQGQQSVAARPSSQLTGGGGGGGGGAAEVLDTREEITDTEDNEEEDLGVLDDQRSVILHLLSQLKLGMDLTRKRSLLEMYANFMAHPDMFLSITSGVTAEERMLRLVEYYLTAFHEGRKGAVAKKPYNPILGESFHCSWAVPCDRVRPLLRKGGVPGSGPGSAPVPAPCLTTRPCPGFYCECKERKMCVNTHVWTKSKFMGMSVGVSMVGEGVLYLLEHGEEYVFTLPCAYARSILTVPVTAEVKNSQTGAVVCRAQGEWNGTLEFTYSSGETKTIDTTKLPVIKKRIRPLDQQGQYESREEKQRAASRTPWRPQHFVREPNDDDTEFPHESEGLDRGVGVKMASME
ncbi:hypothetical protein CRUP_016829 [Coryphaenoides rupestris]|nr:hypothetical protein CRUP_016829 [Coryphaenoides rupestris]